MQRRLSSRWIASSLVLACACMAAGCGDEGPTQPTTFALSGRVQLVGHLTASNGQSLGTRVVDDAGGVPVDLLYGTTVVARTLTSGGAFRFTGIGPGGYVARANIFGSLSVRSGVLTIATRDVAAPSPLVLDSVGDLYPVPNPVDTSTVVTYAIVNNSSAALRVLALDGTVVRHLYVSQMPAPGQYLAEFDGSDDQGAPLAPGCYWLTLEAGSDQRAQLLFR